MFTLHIFSGIFVQYFIKQTNPDLYQQFEKRFPQLILLSMHINHFKRVMNNKRDIHIQKTKSHVFHSFRDLIVYFQKYYTLGKNSVSD